MWTAGRLRSSCTCPLGPSPSSAPLRWRDPCSCHFRAPRTAMTLPHTPRLRCHKGRGCKGQNGWCILCNGATWDGPLTAEAPCAQEHPSESLLRLAQAPVDLNATSLRLAAEELERLYSIPLIAPRGFPRVARLRWPAVAPAPFAAAAMTALATTEGAAADASAPAPARSGFLALGPTSSRAPLCATATSADPSAIANQRFQQGDEGQRLLEAAAAMAKPAPASGPMGAPPPPGRATAGPVRVDPREFPGLAPHRLATLLLESAAQRVPLRLSVLQSYADQVSYRASELAVDDLVSALDGLAKYNFQLVPARAEAPAASAQGPDSISGSGRSSMSGRRSTRPSRTWADRILVCLLAEGSDSDGATAVAVPSLTSGHGVAADAAVAAGEGRRRRSGWGRHGPGRCGPRVASLQPRRAVELARLLVQLSIRPPRGWTEGFLRGTSHIIPRMTGGDLARLLELLAALGATPEATWWDAVLDVWAPTGPPQRQLPRQLPRQQPPAGAAGGTGSATTAAPAVGAVGVPDPRCEHAAVNTTSMAPDIASPGHSPGHGFQPRHATSHDEAAGTVLNGREQKRPVRFRGASLGAGDNSDGGAPGPPDAGPSAVEVRSAILYGILVLGLPQQGPGVATLATRLAGWAQAALYDMAREVLVSRQLACDGPGGVRTFGGGGAGAGDCGGHAVGDTPAAHVIARALAALPAVMRGAARWASDLAGCGGGALAVLVSSLEPRLRELPPGLMVELLRGFSSSRLHPGPRFLLLHAMVLKGRAGELSPRQLLLAARCYTKLGLPPRGGLRAAVLQARELLRRETRKSTAERTIGTPLHVRQGAVADGSGRNRALQQQEGGSITSRQ